MNELCVKNWEKYQHYNNRRPPWIKLYNDLLDNYEFSILDDNERYHVVAIMLLASRTSNRIRHDKKWISRKIDATSEINLERLIELGFLEKKDNKNNGVANSNQDASEDDSNKLDAEEKRREEKNNVHFETFWKNYPRKQDKKRAKIAFFNLTNKNQLKAIEDCKTRFRDTDKQFIPLPTSYIHGERWDDELPKQHLDNHDDFERVL